MVGGRAGAAVWRGGKVFWLGGKVFWRDGERFLRDGPRAADCARRDAVMRLFPSAPSALIFA